MRSYASLSFARLRAMALCWAFSAVAWGQAESPEQAANPASPESLPAAVQITLIAAEPDAELLDRVSSWFPRKVGLEASFQPSLSQSAVVDFDTPSSVGIWILLTEERKEVYFSLRRDDQQRYLNRSFEGSLDEEGREAFAQMVHYSAMAFWQGSLATEKKELEASLTSSPLVHRLSAPPEGDGSSGATGTDSVEPRPQEAEPQTENTPSAEPIDPKPQPETASRATAKAEPATQSHSKMRGSVRVGYGANLRPREALAHGPELSLGLPLGSLAWITLGARWLLPGSFQVDATEVEMTGARLRLLAELPLSLGSQWTLDLGAGGGVDFVNWEVLQSDLTNWQQDTDLRPYLSCAAGIRKDLGLWNFGARALLDVALTKVQYQKEDASEEKVLLSSSLWAPGMAIYVGYSSDL